MLGDFSADSIDGQGAAQDLRPSLRRLPDAGSFHAAKMP
jgi:hypothetical protein